MREATYRFGDVEVEAGGREVRRGGVRVALEPKALDVLLLLLAEPGRVIEKRRLLRDVWADVHVTDSSLARAVTQVRRALGDDIRMPRYIETVPTRGYRFIGELREQQGGAQVADVPAVAVPLDARDTRTWRPLAVLALVAVGTAVAAGLAWRGAVSQAAAAGFGAAFASTLTHAAVQVTTSRGLDATPALSPDGASIAYASDVSGALELYVRPRVGNGATRAVTSNGGDNVEPAWSPDAQWLAFHSRRLGGVWVVAAAGGPARQLVADGASPGWSPDGQSIVYQTAGEADVLGGPGGSPSTLGIVRVATGEVEVLTRRGQPDGSHGSPVWIPGHEAIVFVATQVPTADVWQVSRSGVLTRLGACHATCRPFAFNRGGLAWVGVVRGAKDAELWLAPVGGNGVADMTRARMSPLPRALDVSDLSVSLDGTHMAFTNAERTSEAWALDLPDGRGAAAAATPRVLLGERRPRYSLFAFSADGAHLAYTTSRLGDRAEPWVYELNARESHPLGLAVGGYVKGWEQGGKAVAVTSPGSVGAIERLDLTTGRTTPLIGLDRWATMPDLARRLFTLRLSPDWRRYFYTAEENGEVGVWLAETGGGTPDQLIARDASFGAWSSDGRHVALQSARGWRSSITIVRPDTAAARRLVTDADHAWPNSWSPDDRFVVYAALRQGRWALETVEVATGKVQRLTLPTSAAEYVRWPVWSPRGDLIVYERGYWTGNVWVAPVPDT